VAEIDKYLNLWETHTLIQGKAFAGSSTKLYNVVTGSRIVFTLYVFSISLGASIEIKVKNQFAKDIPTDELLSIVANAPGSTKRVLADFHNYFEIEATVTGGTATFAFGGRIIDNALATKIENAVIEVDLSHTPGIDGRYDSVRIGDGIDLLGVNPDGSLNVNIVSSTSTPSEVIRSEFDTAVGVIANTETEIVSYTVPVGKSALLQRITYGGENVAEYDIYINNIIRERRRTYHGENLCGVADFIGGSEEGLPLDDGDIVSLKLTHIRTYASDHEGRIQVLEIG